MRDMHLIEDNYSSSHILSSATGGKRILPLSKNLPLRVTGQKGTQKDESIAHLRFLGCIPESRQRAASAWLFISASNSKQLAKSANCGHINSYSRPLSGPGRADGTSC